MLTEADLRNFTGTEGYHRWSGLFRRHVLTDGCKHVAEEAGAYWLFDAIASHHAKAMRHQDQRLHEFQIWFLKVKPNNKARLECWADTGEGEHALIVQNIEYTDFPLPEIKFYVAPLDETNFVIMLGSEY